MTGWSCGLALAAAGRRVRLFEAREMAGGASGPTATSRSARRLGVRRRAARPRTGARSHALGAHRACARLSRAPGGRRLPAHGQPAPRGRPGRARRAPCRARRAPRARVRRRMARRAAGAAGRPFLRRDLHSTGWSAPACPLGAASRSERARRPEPNCASTSGWSHSTNWRPTRSCTAWAGIFGTSRTASRSRGGCRPRDGAWVAAGYSGHGNVLGLACGDLIARAILGEQPPELELFDPARLLGR